MSGSRLTPGTLCRAVLLAFGLIVAALIFRQLATLVLAVLIVVILALPLAAFADRLERRQIPGPLAADRGRAGRPRRRPLGARPGPRGGAGPDMRTPGTP